MSRFSCGPPNSDGRPPGRARRRLAPAKIRILSVTIFRFATQSWPAGRPTTAIALTEADISAPALEAPETRHVCPARRRPLQPPLHPHRTNSAPRSTPPTAISRRGSINRRAMAFCAAHRAFMIVDPPYGRLLGDAPGFPDSDRYDQSRRALFPDASPVGSAARQPARRLRPVRHGRRRHGSHRSAARRLESARRPRGATLGVAALSVPLTDAENGKLNPSGINCLRTIPAAGRVVWGSRTLRGADQLAPTNGNTFRSGGRRSFSRKVSTAGRSGWCLSLTMSRSGRRFV